MPYIHQEPGRISSYVGRAYNFSLYVASENINLQLLHFKTKQNKNKTRTRQCHIYTRNQAVSAPMLEGHITFPYMLQVKISICNCCTSTILFALKRTVVKLMQKYPQSTSTVNTCTRDVWGARLHIQDHPLQDYLNGSPLIGKWSIGILISFSAWLILWCHTKIDPNYLVWPLGNDLRCY